MKKTLRSLAGLLVASASLASSFAQAPVYQKPFLEIFSGSTCPPCKPASDYYNPVLDANHGEIVFVKYPMSWPGAGDPYFTDEGNERRNYYGVTGVPDSYVNGTDFSTYNLNDAVIATWNQEIAKVRMKLKYMVDPATQEVTIVAEAKAMEAVAGPLRIFVAITEETTYNNVRTNGETEFHEVLKKQVPNGNGFSYFQGLAFNEKAEISTSYTFQGNYREPAGASDQIDNATEHSVEDFNNLNVIAWVQNIQTKEVYQSVQGTEVSTSDELVFVPSQEEWVNGIAEEGFNNAFETYPNPANDQINVEFEFSAGTDVTINITDMLGKVVYTHPTQGYGAGQNRVILPVSNLETGIYMVNVYENGQKASRRVSVAR